MIPAETRSALTETLGPRIEWDVPLRRYTSLRVGGPADAVATPSSIDEVAACVRICAAAGVRVTPLGGGFNTLVADEGVDGVVLRTQGLRALEVEPDVAADPDAPRLLHAEAGVSHAQIWRLCARRGLSGLEFGAGIPGTVGGWVAMNAGIPAREVRDALKTAVIVSAAGERRDLTREALGLVYRNASALGRADVVVAARFAVAPATPEAVRAEVDRHLEERRHTQPLDVPTCGSVFKNPPGEHAGRLIEQAGLKGASEGGASISCVHANFIATSGSACADDVFALIERTQRVVREHTGIELEPEVRVLRREQ